MRDKYAPLVSICDRMRMLPSKWCNRSLSSSNRKRFNYIFMSFTNKDFSPKLASHVFTFASCYVLQDRQNQIDWNQFNSNIVLTRFRSGLPISHLRAHTHYVQFWKYVQKLRHEFHSLRLQFHLFFKNIASHFHKIGGSLPKFGFFLTEAKLHL